MSASFFTLTIRTPDRVAWEGVVQRVVLPVLGGEVTILPNHTPYIAALVAGEVLIYDEDGNAVPLAISRGFCDFFSNTLTILTDSADRVQDLELSVIEEAKQRAEEMQKHAVSMDEITYARVAATLERELARLKVLRKYRK